MNDVLARAEALTRIVETGGIGDTGQATAEAVVSCCTDLVRAGEAGPALALAELWLPRLSVVPPEWRLRTEIIRVRALSYSRRDHDALHLVQSIRDAYDDILTRGGSEDQELKILECASLWHLSRVQEAIDRLLAIRQELLTSPDSALLALCALNLGSAETVRGNYRAAWDYTLESVVSARRCRSQFLEGQALINLALLERFRCRWHSADDYSQEALRLIESEGNQIQTSHVLRALGLIAWKRGRPAAALEFSAKSVRSARLAGHQLFIDFGKQLESLIHLHCGEYEQALRVLRSLIPKDIAWPHDRSRAALLNMEYLGDIHLEQGEAEQALKLYDEVWPKALALVPKGDIVAELRRRRAECYLLMGHDREAFEEAKTGLEHCRELGDRYEEAATYRVLAMSAAAIGKPAEAKRWFEQGFAYYDDIETPYEWGKLWMAYGDWLAGPLAAEFSDRKGALEAYEAARDHFERMGAKAKLAEAEARIARITPIGSNVVTADVAVSGSRASRRPLRRPREQRDADARSKWALETFGMVTRDRQVLALLDNVQQLARSTAPVLVLGESGTGKELIANAIHEISARKGSFMPINCAALPREIMESELFGHTAGSFTGATKEKMGLFEVCDRGTAFLDEIAEMPQELQSRLLRFLETGEVRRVGANRQIEVNTRIVAATNRERAALEKGDGFRTDLYYRLAHAVVTLPPLRRRADDIDLLIEHFLAESNREEAKQVELSEAAYDRLAGYSWPGNIRQMRAVIRRIVILSRAGQRVEPEHLDLSDDTQVATTLLEELEMAERRRVEEALQNARGSRTEAAKKLGMPRTTFINKLRRYGLMK